MKKVTVFDFDGTLTVRDTMFDFIGFACGKRKLYLGLILFAPIIAIMFMKVIDNNTCKQWLLSWYFKGWKYADFKLKGEEYKERVVNILNQDTVSKLKQHLATGDTVYVISASIYEWVAPICLSLGVHQVLSTEMEVDERGVLTGRFSNHNCFGAEKVNRLSSIEPNRRSYFLTAYGDSRGDLEMFQFADEKNLVQ